MSVGGHAVHYEAPEAARYRAPLLVSTGLFQSFECWRSLTSMLAHRGWEIYVAERSAEDEDHGWDACASRLAEIARGLDEPPILLGADLGAALALSIAKDVGALALVLFAPATPAELAKRRPSPRDRRWGRLAGALSRKPQPSGPSAHVPEELERLAPWPEAAVAEPRRLLGELADRPFSVDEQGPPSLVFAPADDPLVTREGALAFATESFAVAARSQLDGRFWPAHAPQKLADEVHRFLILTLGDRVVDFPDEILED